MAKSKTTPAPEETETIQLQEVEKISKDDETTALATVTKDDLKKLEAYDAVIQRFKREYSDLKINGAGDVEGYEKVRMALGEMRSTRTGLMAEKKEWSKPYRITVAWGNSRFSEKINTIAATEAPLKAMKKEIDDAEALRKQQTKEAEEGKLNERINDLITNGAAFDGNFYSIKDDELGISEISIGVVDLRVMSDEFYANFLKQVVDKNALILSEKERVQKEKQAMEAEEKRKAAEAKAQLEKEQEQLRKEREAMELERKQMQEERDRIAKEKEEEQLRKEKEEKEKRQAVFNARYKQLTDLGMTLNAQYMAYVYEDVNLDIATEITLWSNDEFDAKIKEVTPIIAKRKEAAAKKIEEERLAEEKRIAEKALADKAEQDRLAEEKRKEELASQKDTVKWNDLVTRLKQIELPEMAGPKFTSKVQKVKEFIDNL